MSDDRPDSELSDTELQRKYFNSPSIPTPNPTAGENLYGDGAFDMRTVKPGDRYGNPGAETEALSDSESTASNNLLYGGYKNAASDEMQNFRSWGEGMSRRNAPAMDTSQTNQSRGMAAGLGHQLRGLAAGDPNSQAQQQLARGYGTANNAAMGLAASARGGAVARGAAQRMATNQVGENGQAQQAASRDLMAREQMGAYGQLGTLGNATRATDQATAFGNANREMTNRNINDAEQARRETMRQQVGTLALQGQKNRIGAQSSWMGIQSGQSQQTERLAQEQANRDLATKLKIGEGALGGGAGLAESYLERNRAR